MLSFVVGSRPLPETVQFVIQYGYLLLFGWVLVEQAGMPIPASPLLLAAGAVAGQGRMSLVAVVLSAALGSFVSDTAWFYVGKKRGASVLRILCKIALEPDTCVRQTEAKFAKFGNRTLLFAKFVPGLNTAAPSLSAVVGVPYARFAIFDFAGAVLWAGSFALAGFVFSNQLDRVAVALSRFGSGVVLLFVAVILGYIGYRYYDRQRFLNQVKGDRILPEELKSKIDLGEPVSIIDLRHPLDLVPDPRTLPGALRISPEELELRQAEIPREVDIVLFCT